MDHQQDGRPETDLHVGSETGGDCEGRDVGRVPRRRNRTARIKQSTRNALMDQLALAADEIERQRWDMRVAEQMYDELVDENFELQSEYLILQRRWWHRLMWWR